MSHELTQRADGLVEFAYRADHGLPWHGLGQSVPETDYRNVDAWTRHAGMDWKVARSRVRFGEGPQQRVYDDHHVLFRSDTKAPLGVVGKGYKIVQPREVMEFFRDLAKAGGVELSAAGTIYGGKRFWATAKMGEAYPVSRKDRVDGFLLFSTSADGSLASEVRRSSTRVVCRNTLAIALGEKPAVRVEYADRHVRAQSDQNRFVSAQWGSGADLKTRMFDLLTA